MWDNTRQQFRGIIMPQGVSADIQNALCSHVQAVLESSELRSYIAESELIPGYMGPEEFRSFVEAQDAALLSLTEQRDSEHVKILWKDRDDVNSHGSSSKRPAGGVMVIIRASLSTSGTMASTNGTSTSSPDGV